MKVFVILFIILIIAIGFFGIASGYLVDANTVTRTLEDQGYTNIEIVGRDNILVGFLGGGKEDVAKFTVSAINPIGKQVVIHVFVGWPFKGATIRGK